MPRPVVGFNSRGPATNLQGANFVLTVSASQYSSARSRSRPRKLFTLVCDSQYLRGPNVVYSNSQSLCLLHSIPLIDVTCFLFYPYS